MTFEEWSEENWMLIDIKSNAKDIWDAAQKEEREACADVCRHKAIEFANIANEESSEHYDNMERGALDCERSIRARSNADATGLAPAQEITK